MSNTLSKAGKVIVSTILTFLALFSPYISNSSVLASIPVSHSAHPTTYTAEQLKQIRQNAIAHYHPMPVPQVKNGKEVLNTDGDSGTPPLINVGGSSGQMMKTSKVYLIFWKPSGYSMDSNYESTIEQYFSDIASTSAPLYNIATQYYDNIGGHFQNSITYGGAVEDTNSFPSWGCYDIATDGCLSDSQIHNEIANVASAQGWEADFGSNFFLYTPANIGSSFSVGSTTWYAYADASLTPHAYCSYHNSYYDSSTSNNFIYAQIPYPGQSYFYIPRCEGLSNWPTNDSSYQKAYNAINFSSHEHFEMITDPDPMSMLGTGPVWVTDDTSPSEMADLCGGSFPSSLIDSGQADLEISGHYYMVQEEYSNAIKPNGSPEGCEMQSADTNAQLSGTIYASSFYGSTSNVKAYNMNDGTLRWYTSSCNCTDGQTPVVDTVYGDVYVIDSSYNIHQILATSGTKSSTTFTGNDDVSSFLSMAPQVSSAGNFFAAGRWGSIYSFAPNGTNNWNTYLASGNIVQPPIYNSGYVYAQTANGDLYKLDDSSSGSATLLWQAPSGYTYNNPLTFSDGKLYFEIVNSSATTYYYESVDATTGSSWDFAASGSGWVNDNEVPLTVVNNHLFEEANGYFGGINIDPSSANYQTMDIVEHLVNHVDSTSIIYSTAQILTDGSHLYLTGSNSSSSTYIFKYDTSGNYITEKAGGSGNIHPILQDDLIFDGGGEAVNTSDLTQRYSAGWTGNINIGTAGY